MKFERFKEAIKRDIRSSMKTFLALGVLFFFFYWFELRDNTSSDGKWHEIGNIKSGNTFYVDFDSIKKADGFVYFWMLRDLVKPTSRGNFSNKAYIQGDCKLSPTKRLSFSSYTQPMGKGTPSSSSNKEGE